MEKLNVCDFYDVISYGTKNHGIPHNKLHDMLVDIDIHLGCVYVDDIAATLGDNPDYLTEENKQAMEIVVEFAEFHGVQEFYIAPKNW